MRLCDAIDKEFSKNVGDLIANLKKTRTLKTTDETIIYYFDPDPGMWGREAEEDWAEQFSDALSKILEEVYPEISIEVAYTENTLWNVPDNNNLIAHDEIINEIDYILSEIFNYGMADVIQKEM